MAKSYGDKHVFSGVNFMVERGDRIALVGVNGAGKSTLIKLLAGAEPLSTGEYTLGHNVEVEYFAAGTTIVQAEGGQLDHLYVVRTGSVHVIDRGRVVDELLPGDTFGYLSVLSGLPPPLSVATRFVLVSFERSPSATCASWPAERCASASRPLIFCLVSRSSRRGVVVR